MIYINFYWNIIFLNINFTWILFFCSIDLSVEEGGGSLELIPGGRDIEVTASNVYDYVRKYAEYRMYKAQYKALEVSIREFKVLYFYYSVYYNVFC